MILMREAGRTEERRQVIARIRDQLWPEKYRTRGDLLNARPMDRTRRDPGSELDQQGPTRERADRAHVEWRQNVTESRPTSINDPR